MKKNLTLQFFLSLYFSPLLWIGAGGEAIAQNLVHNPSFEDTISCPITISEMFKADQWYSFRETPDYYHTCDNPINGVVGVPQNNLGFQYPHTGLAYGGFIAYDLTGSPPAQREYLANELSSATIPGTKYYATFFVSWLGSLGFGIVINKLGINFTNNLYFQSTPYPVDNSPFAYSTSFYSDSTGWAKVQLSFVADSAYQYMVIGDFFDDANTDTIHMGQFNTHCYYYIDDVCLSTDSLFSENWTAISETSFPSGEILIYPNPAKSSIYLINAKSNMTYSLINLMGEVVKKGILNSHSEINIASCPNGIYILELENKYFYKFIIHR